MHTQIIKKFYSPDIQLGINQIEFIAESISLMQPNCKILVFGCGFDSPLWAALNKGGRTVFLESSVYWKNKLLCQAPTLEIHDYALPLGVTVTSTLQSGVPDIPPPPVMQEEQWDVIIIDGPPGHSPDTDPGRAFAIEWVAKVRSPHTHIFLDDMNRPLEHKYGTSLLGITQFIINEKDSAKVMGYSTPQSQPRGNPRHSASQYTKKTALCFGTEDVARNILPFIKSDYLSIRAFVDERPHMRASTYMECPVIDFTNILDIDVDYILIACRADDRVFARLIELGIPEEKIVSCNLEALFHRQARCEEEQIEIRIRNYLALFPAIVSAFDIPALLQSTWVQWMRQAFCVQSATNVTLVSGCDRLRFNSFVNHKIFTEKNGVAYFWGFHTKIKGASDARFEKIRFLSQLHGASEWLMWIDDDCYFTDFSWKLNEFLQDFSNVDMLICGGAKQEAGAWGYFNSGAFFLRSTKRSREFLEAVLATDPEKVKQWWDDERLGVLTNGEQPLIGYVLLTDKRFTEGDFWIRLDATTFNARYWHFDTSADQHPVLHLISQTKTKKQIIDDFREKFNLNEFLVPDEILDQYDIEQYRHIPYTY